MQESLAHRLLNLIDLLCRPRYFNARHRERRSKGEMYLTHFLTPSSLWATYLIFDYGAALSIPPKPSITVFPVTTPSDVLALADLRYTEWMSGADKPPSPGAFRAATAEIHTERCEAGATTFLARIEQNGPAVGSAEVSSIEFDGVFFKEDKQEGEALYVTDVVTSRNYRRKGVGNALMEAVEHAAIDRGARRLFLHVEDGNDAALGFYRKKSLGYAEPTQNVTEGLDVEKLAENAGTTGQILLYKELGKIKPPDRTAGGGGGFGGVSITSKGKNPKRKKGKYR